MNAMMKVVVLLLLICHVFAQRGRGLQSSIDGDVDRLSRGADGRDLGSWDLNSKMMMMMMKTGITSGSKPSKMTMPSSLAPVPTLAGMFQSPAPTPAPTSAPTSTPTRAPTSSPTSSPTRAPTSSPTSSPTRAPTPALAPKMDLTDAIAGATFIPGGLEDIIEPGSVFNVSTVRGDPFSYFEISGKLQVVDEGIVALANLGPDVMVYCDPESKAIEVYFNFAVGEDQFDHIFPLGSVLVINQLAFGPCRINPSTAPANLAEIRRDLTADAYMVIESVIPVNNATCIILGKTGTFFTMFSSGSLSIKKVEDRRLLQDRKKSEQQSHNEVEDSNSAEEGTRRDLQTGCPSSPGIFFDIHYVSASLEYSHNSALDELVANWDSSGLAMTANVTLDALGTYDMYFEIVAGAVIPGRIDQDTCYLSKRMAFLPPILGNFPILSNYFLPEYFFNIVFDAPLHLESAGTSQGEAEGFYYSTRLKYRTGLKKFTLSAGGSWDALKVKVDTVQADVGGFDAATFLTPPQKGNTFEFYPAKNYSDTPAGPMDFTLSGGMTQNVVVYGSLFSAVMGVKIDMGFTTNKAPGYYPPDGTSLTSTCAQCPKVKVVGYAKTTEMTLDVSVGHFVQTDLVGPSLGNTPANLQTSLAIDPAINAPALINKSTMCLYTKFGQESTTFCINRCCNAEVATCTAINATVGRCVRI